MKEMSPMQEGTENARSVAFQKEGRTPAGILDLRSKICRSQSRINDSVLVESLDASL
jgi:hypothetical protein